MAEMKGTKKTDKRTRKSYTSKGQRIGSMKTAGFDGPFVSGLRTKIATGWSEKERKRITQWLRETIRSGVYE